MLADANIATLRRIHNRLLKVKTRLPPRRVSKCRPQEAPMHNWKPKNAMDAHVALKLMSQGLGVRSAPFPVSAPSWQHKFFASDVAEMLRSQRPCSVGERAATAVSALLVSSLSARAVETAMAIKASDPLVHADAKIDMQSSKQDSGWDKTKTGSCSTTPGSCSLKRLWSVWAPVSRRGWERGALDEASARHRRCHSCPGTSCALVCERRVYARWCVSWCMRVVA